jgi:hypothetical protein
MPNFNRIIVISLRIIIPVGFLIFLATSIDHLAWSFGIFDKDMFRQYGGAIAIDLTCAILSIFTMFCYESLSRSTKWAVWIVIVFLLGFSWWGNWHFAVMHRDPTIYQNPSLSPFSDFDTIIFSANIAFGAIYIKLASSLSVKEPTVEEILNRAGEITAMAEAQKALRDAKGKQRQAKGTWADKVTAVTKEATAAIQQSSAIVADAINNSKTQPATAPTSEAEQTEDEGKGEEEGGQDETEQVNEASQSHRPFTVVPGSGKRKPHTVKGARETDLSISIETVAKELGLSTAQVTRLAQSKDCLLTATRRNKKMITKASFAAYKKAKAETEAS